VQVIKIHLPASLYVRVFTKTVVPLSMQINFVNLPSSLYSIAVECPGVFVQLSLAASVFVLPSIALFFYD
jgi:hypothetical protein